MPSPLNLPGANEIHIKLWTIDGYYEFDSYNKWEPMRYDVSKFHRLDGPAFERCPTTANNNWSKMWFVYGKHHRIDGPACEYSDGGRSWWINGRILNCNAVEDWIKENNIDLKTIEGQTALKLRWI